MVAYFILRLPDKGTIDDPNLAKVITKNNIDGNITAYSFVHKSAITAYDDTHVPAFIISPM